MPSLWEELLPGIPHDVTLTHISTKLPWKAFHVLSKVSSNWRREIQRRELYSERIRSCSAEQLSIVQNPYDDFNHGPYEGKHGEICDHSCLNSAISLYSVSEKTLYELPPIPHVHGFSQLCEAIQLNGRLYVCSHIWRGPRQMWFKSDNEETQVHVLDLSGGGQWEECTLSRTQFEPESEFAAAIRCGYTLGEEHFLQGGSADWYKSSWVSSYSRPEGLPSRAKRLERLRFYPDREFTTADGSVYSPICRVFL